MSSHNKYNPKNMEVDGAENFLDQPLQFQNLISTVERYLKLQWNY
ncbi:hypothetical protein TUMEXPCC7403_18750 [Tumidithrix helvetica PCC 7403]